MGRPRDQGHTLRIDESLVSTNQGAAWGNAKNERSRRTIPIDADTMRVFARRRAEQAAERLVAGRVAGNDLIITTRTGRLVLPRSYDRALATIVDNAWPRIDLARPAPHRSDPHGPVRERPRRAPRHRRPLGHSPEMLMNTYAHALPNSQAAVVDRLRRS